MRAAARAVGGPVSWVRCVGHDRGSWRIFGGRAPDARARGRGRTTHPHRAARPRPSARRRACPFDGGAPRGRTRDRQVDLSSCSWWPACRQGVTHASWLRARSRAGRSRQEPGGSEWMARRCRSCPAAILRPCSRRLGRAGRRCSRSTRSRPCATRRPARPPAARPRSARARTRLTSPPEGSGQDLRNSWRNRSSADLPASSGNDSSRNSTSSMRSARKNRKSSRSSHHEPAIHSGG